MWIELMALADENPMHEISMKLCLPATQKDTMEVMKTINPCNKQDFGCIISKCDMDMNELEEYITCRDYNMHEIAEINFLSERLTYLTGQQQKTMAHILENGTESDIRSLINLTYHLDHPTFQHITNDEQLGFYYITTGKIEIPDNLIEFLDLKKLGLHKRKQDNGLYIDDAYVVIEEYNLTEPYDGQTFPDVMKGVDVPMKVKLKANDSDDHCVWQRLPITEREKRMTCEKLGVEDLVDAQIVDVYSLIQGFDMEVLKDACLVELDTLAGTIRSIDKKDWLILEAVIQYETRDLNPIHVSDYYSCGLNIECYDHFAGVMTPVQYGRRHLEEISVKIPDSMQQFIDYKAIGAQKIFAENGKFTDYGYVCRNENEYIDICESEETMQQKL